MGAADLIRTLIHRAPKVLLLNVAYRADEPSCGMVCAMFPSWRQKRVSELCSRVVAANDPSEFAQAVSELRAALRAQLTHLRELVYEAKQTIAQLPPAPFHERRTMERRRMERRQGSHQGAAGSSDASSRRVSG